VVSIAVVIEPSAHRGQSQRKSLRPAVEARIEDLGRGDLAKVDCAACHHVALLTPEPLMRLGLSPGAKVLDLSKGGSAAAGAEGGAVVSIKWLT
jgi:hypothetical protein